ncbi:hypothetical protein I6N90_09800 [Paenibacillus sp. GSMTC-2017]|uniref:hypothetical protein n=1 Tax=Paenibacillus sp. GSMTC-2017 TaxID=2794350 RepID=UPI0018D8F274|nr:hypothetical protein [Paenibacillus sp. GSMTC-2017]MBH5318100.1 hypothetical protein [Paenibacillus sp. GSMTC-2017]
MENNRTFQRFLHENLPKESREVGLLPLASNLLKQVALNQNSSTGIVPCTASF